MRHDLNSRPILHHLLPLHLHTRMLTYLLLPTPFTLITLSIMPLHRFKPIRKHRALEHFLPIMQHLSIPDRAFDFFAAAGDELVVVGCYCGGEGVGGGVGVGGEVGGEGDEEVGGVADAVV